MPEIRSNISKIKAALTGSFDRVKPILRRLHPSDIAEILDGVSAETRKKILALLPIHKASEALVEMDDEEDAAELLADMSPERAAQLIEELDPDDAADLLSQIPKEDLIAILNQLPAEEERVIERLMAYDKETAGGIMNPETFRVSASATKREALQEIIEMSDEMEDFYVIYAVDDQNQFIGVVSIKDLLRAQPNKLIRDIVTTEAITVHVDTDQEAVANLMRKYDLPTIPVLDSNKQLLGRVTFDDIMDVIQEENTEDMFKIAGVSQEEEIRGGWADAVKSRIPWLMVNLITASIAGLVIGFFEPTIQKIAIITVYMPMIAGVAGNGATQTLAVTLRRIVTTGVNQDEIMSVIRKEVSVGLINGVLIGLIVSVIALVTRQNPMLGLVVFLAMMGNLIIAGFAGSAVPLILKRMNVDPAIASSILITAFTDIIGYSLLLGLGSLFLL